MRTTRTLATAVAAAALVAGGLAAAAPATAAHSPKAKTTFSGSTSITVPGATVNAALAAGLGIYTVAPGTTSLGSGNAATVMFPVTGATGGIQHKGTLVFVNGAAGKTVTFADPLIDPKAGTVSGVVGGVGAPFDGQRLPILTVSNLKAVTKVTKPNARTTVTTLTATATVSLNKAIPVQDVLNNALATTIFTSGMTIGTAKVKSVTTVVR